MRFFMQSLHHLILVLLNPLLFLLQLNQLCLINQNLILFIQLRSQFYQLLLIFSNQSFLVQIFIN